MLLSEVCLEAFFLKIFLHILENNGKKEKRKKKKEKHF